MSPRTLTAGKSIAPFVAIELAMIATQWFLIPEGSSLTYVPYFISVVVLPSLAAARLARAAFRTSVCVLSALTFALVGIAWVAVGVALTRGDWRHLSGYIIATSMFGIPLQLMSAFLGARYAHLIFRAAT